MEKLIGGFEIGLLLWQLFLVALFVAVIYFIYKLYKKIMQ
ncbi:hypothetical protein BSF42_21510 [Flavobacterium sp. ACN6]|nr:hypothetical protein BSF42_21510 [Flavobacterium sp. ACN6]